MPILLNQSGQIILTSGGVLTATFGDTPAAPAGDFERPTYSSTPTLAQVERVYMDRRLQRPDWWVYGDTPKVVGVDSLPAGCSYDAGTNRITVSGTVASLNGWDFAATETSILMSSGSRIDEFLHNRMCMRSVPKSDRVAVYNGSITINPAIQFTLNIAASIGRMAYCWFRPNAEHGGGPFAAAAYIVAQSNNNSNYAGIDVVEWCSFEGYGNDALKTVRPGVWRFNLYDPAFNVPPDATDYAAGTYNAGDVVYSSTNDYFVRLCVNNGVTAAPDFSTKLADTTNWKALDPHSDQDQIAAQPDNTLLEWYGNFANRNQELRRFPSRMFNTGVVNWLRAIPNNPANQNLGANHIHHNIILDEVEQRFSNQEAIEFASLADSYGNSANTKVVENNWYQNQLTTSAGTHITVSGNTSGWTLPSAATLSSVSMTANTVRADLNFTANTYGWMRVVFTTTQGALTAEQILAATVGGSILGVAEVDVDPDAAASAYATISATASTTLYAYGLFQAGGGNDTLTSEQSATVAAQPTTLSIVEPTQTKLPYPPNNPDGYAVIPVTVNTDPGAAVLIPDYRTDQPSTEILLGVANGSGVLSTTFLATGQTGRYFSPQVRLRDNPAVTDTMTAALGVGHNIMLESQSIWGNPLNAGVTGLAVAEDGVIQETENNAGFAIFAEGETTHNWFQTIAANYILARGNPKHCYGIFWGVKSGESMIGILDDSDTTRNFADWTRMLNRVRTDGSDFSLFFSRHAAADVRWNDVQKHVNFYAPAFLGINSAANGGGAVADGATVTQDSDSFTSDRCFFDLSPASLADPTAGRGIFRWDKTTMVMTRTGGGPTAAVSPITDSTEHAAGTQAVKQFTGFRVICEQATALGLPAKAHTMLGFKTGDGVHPATDVGDPRTYGASQVFTDTAAIILDALGEREFVVPVITGVTCASDGSKATVQYNVPIWTQAYQLSSDTDVTGFEVNLGAGWSLPAVTATLVGNGDTGQVELTVSGGFGNDDQMRDHYAAGWGYWNNPDQDAAYRLQKLIRAKDDAYLTLNYHGPVTECWREGDSYYTASGIA